MNLLFFNGNGIKLLLFIMNLLL